MRKLVQEEGYSVTDICYAFEVSRSSYYYNKTKPDEKEEDENTDQDFTKFNWQVLEEIEEVKMSHPFYSYHRVRARVNGEFKVPINHKRRDQMIGGP